MRATGLRANALVLALCALVAIGAAGCARQTEDEVDETSVLIIEAEPTALVFDLNDPPNLAGVSTARSKIEAGDCFNEYLFRDRADFLQEVTTIVSCGNPHDREAYFHTEYPGSETDNYPLDDELKRWAESMCLDEFYDFVGREYVLSQLEIGTFVPTFEGWNEGDRNVICYVYPDKGGRLRASVRNSDL